MAGDRGRHVRLYGLQVTDEPTYRRYREAMTPILHRHGGAFGHDLVVSQVLASETDRPMNRVFTIRFRDAASAEALFRDPGYLDVRRRLFEPSVAATTEIAAFDEPTPDLAAAT